MNAAIYKTDTGQIIRRVCVPTAFMMDQILSDDEEFYLNCPSTATHIIDNEPTTIISTNVDELLYFIRIERNSLLSKCDWTQVSDAPLTSAQKQSWATYRQALRNFPDTCDPNNPVWPTPPA